MLTPPPTPLTTTMCTALPPQSTQFRLLLGINSSHRVQTWEMLQHNETQPHPCSVNCYDTLKRSTYAEQFHDKHTFTFNNWEYLQIYVLSHRPHLQPPGKNRLYQEGVHLIYTSSVKNPNYVSPRSKKVAYNKDLTMDS